MKKLTVSAIALSAAVAGFASSAQAQQAKLFFESDIVRGGQRGAPGPACVLNNQFKRLEKVVFRIRVLDQAGHALDAKGLKSLAIELPDGKKLSARYGDHPPARNGQTPLDHFWTAVWIIPTGYPTGSLSYKVLATGEDGSTQTWEPFKTKTSQLAVVDGQIEIKLE
jgi:hypothetical protein